MSTEFSGFSSPAAGFEVPLEMLAARHLRIEQHCMTLQRLAQHLRSHGPDEQARAAAVSLKRYFDVAAMDHHADEEVDLFPALIESMAGSDAVCLREMIAALSADHRALETHWQRLRVLLQKVAAGMPAVLDCDDVEGFVGLYQRHIARETAELLPMAQRLLGDEELDRIGLAMRVRRHALGDMPAAPD
jgi:hemerythrin-like domain-containing protein